MAAIEGDPEAKQALNKALFRLHHFAQHIKATRSTNGTLAAEAMERIRGVFAVVDGAIKNVIAEQRQQTREYLAKLEVEQGKLFNELKDEIRRSAEKANADLDSHGFEPPKDDLEAWEELARIVEKEPGPMTIEEIYRWAIAWAKREIMRQKLARGETPVRRDDGGKSNEPGTASAEDASIRPDEHNPAIVWCVGKRVYLGDDTQISRLFWLLASPVGRARSLGEVQRAVDGFETSRDMDATGEEFKKARQSGRLHHNVRD